MIDTDVILDFFFDRKPFSDHAAGVFTLCESKTIKGHVTAVIISNVYYLLSKTAKHEKVVDKLNQLITLTDVLTIDKETIRLALHSSFNDFEDALQNFTAEVNGDLDVIVTRNIKDYKNSTLGVMTPEHYLEMLTTIR